MALPDCLRTTEDAAKRYSYPSSSAEKRSKPPSPSRSQGSRARRLTRFSSPPPTACRPPVHILARCGGCHYQHANYEHQLEIKKEILHETLRRTAKLELPGEIEVHASPPWNYRNRSRLQVQVSPAFAAGYFKLASHDLLAVEECPISSPLINRGIAMLWQSGRAGKVPPGVREIEFFANADDTQLLLEVECVAEARRARVRAWAEELRAALPEIAGVTHSARADPAWHERSLSQRRRPLPYLPDSAGTYRVSAGSFFQTNRYMTDELVRIVTQGQSGELALDLYAGVGLFSTALACDFHHVVSVESSQTSSADLSYNQPSNGKAVQATAEQYLARAENSGWVGKGTVLPHIPNKPDLAVVDPPRSGLGEPVARLLANLGRAAGCLCFVRSGYAGAGSGARCWPPAIAWSKCTWWTYFRRPTTWKAWFTWHGSRCFRSRLAALPEPAAVASGPTKAPVRSMNRDLQLRPVHSFFPSKPRASPCSGPP